MRVRAQHGSAGSRTRTAMGKTVAPSAHRSRPAAGAAATAAPTVSPGSRYFGKAPEWIEIEYDLSKVFATVNRSENPIVAKHPYGKGTFKPMAHLLDVLNEKDERHWRDDINICFSIVNKRIQRNKNKTEIFGVDNSKSESKLENKCVLYFRQLSSPQVITHTRDMFVKYIDNTSTVTRTNDGNLYQRVVNYIIASYYVERKFDECCDDFARDEVCPYCLLSIVHFLKFCLGTQIFNMCFVECSTRLLVDCAAERVVKTGINIGGIHDAKPWKRIFVKTDEHLPEQEIGYKEFNTSMVLMPEVRPLILEFLFAAEEQMLFQLHRLKRTGPRAFEIDPAQVVPRREVFTIPNNMLLSLPFMDNFFENELSVINLVNYDNKYLLSYKKYTTLAEFQQTVAELTEADDDVLFGNEQKHSGSDQSAVDFQDMLQSYAHVNHATIDIVPTMYKFRGEVYESHKLQHFIHKASVHFQKNRTQFTKAIAHMETRNAQLARELGECRAQLAELRGDSVVIKNEIPYEFD